jgi:COMPASS component SWD3
MEMEVQGEGKSKEAWVVTGSENGKMMLWELRSRRVLQVLEVEGVQQRPIVAIAVSLHDFFPSEH